MSSRLGNVIILASLAVVLFSISKTAQHEGENGRSSRVAQAQMTGQWSIEGQRGVDNVRLQLERRDTEGDRESISVHLDLTRLQGLTPEQVYSGASRVDFQLVREAGTFTFSGSFREGRGAGQWTFNINPAFAVELRKHGYERVTEEELYALALSDVGTAYISELEQAGYRKLTVSQLVAFYTNDVRADYIASLGSVGYTELFPNELVALRSNGITANDARIFGELVSGDIPAKQLIALKSNGVTEAYIKSLQEVGYKRLTAGQLIALRTNGVTRDFIERLQGRGHKNLPVERILSIRINAGDQY